jgi:hypothetical protein
MQKITAIFFAAMITAAQCQEHTTHNQAPQTQNI